MPQAHEPYLQLQTRLIDGWNTCNTWSTLAHVRMPAGLQVHLGIQRPTGGYTDHLGVETPTGGYLNHALIGRTAGHQEQIRPGPRTYGGGYTDLTLTWAGCELRVQSAVFDDRLLLLVEPMRQDFRPTVLTVCAGMLWNRPGQIVGEGRTLRAAMPDESVTVHVAGGEVTDETQTTETGPYVAVHLSGPVAVATGEPIDPDAAQRVIADARARNIGEAADDLSEIASAIRTCLAWDTIYAPDIGRTISPVSRIWNTHYGGWVLFEWDTYFAAYLASLENRDLAIANAVQITECAAPFGYVPNTTSASGFITRDRSQPPVGAMTVHEIYRRFGDRWFVERVFDGLLTWNRWWPNARQIDGLLAWGSNPYTPVVGNRWETPERGVGGRFGAALESGLDNSPMYDDIPFDAERHVLKLQDVGLNGLYVRDCECLAALARVIGRDAEAGELDRRAEHYRASMRRLWNEEAGIFCNRRTDTGEWSMRLSPTNFYALLARAATPEQARRMVDEHLLNPDAFWGDWVLPSIARSDPAYPDNTYWRGRIWPPMNWLVYLSLRMYDATRDAAAALADKSAALLLADWRAHGHVYENYNADTGVGGDVRNSDAFYHWGGLLGMPAMIEARRMPAPERPLD